MFVNRSTTTYKLSVLTRQMMYARRKATNSIRSRMVTRSRGQRSEVRSQMPGVVAALSLTTDFWLLSSGPGLVLKKILVDVVVGLSCFAVAVAVGAEFADRVGHGPAFILHSIDRGQGTRSVQPGHAVDEDRKIRGVVAQLQKVVDHLRPVRRTRLVSHNQSAIPRPGKKGEFRALLGAYLALA